MGHYDKWTTFGFLTIFITASVGTPCYQRTNNGIINSPTFPDPPEVNSDLCWILHAENNKQVEWVLSEMWIGEDDTLSVYAGEEELDEHLIYQLSGFPILEYDQYVRSYKSTMRIRLVIGPAVSIVHSGFNGTFQSVDYPICAEINSETTLDYVGGPFWYDDSDVCWNIIGNPMEPVRLEFTMFDTRWRTDRVLVYDGSSFTDPWLLAHSGDALPNPNPLVSTSSEMMIAFFCRGSRSLYHGFTVSIYFSGLEVTIEPAIVNTELPVTMHPLCSNCEVSAGSPVVNSISTNKGPIAGGTRLTIIGSMLAPSDEPRIYLHVNGQLDVLLCANAIGTSEELTCHTKPFSADASEVDRPSTLKLKWLLNPRVLELAQTFTYKGNPTITAITDRMTFVAGGTKLKVDGTNMDVPDTITMVQIVHITGQETQVFDQECKAVSSTLIHCLTKDLRGVVPTDTTKDAVTIVHLGFIFDGYTDYQDLRDTALHSQSTLTYFQNPTLTSSEKNWKHLECVIEGQENVYIKVGGTGLNIGISSANYEIVIGDGSGRCEDVQVFDNTIKCKAPTKKPADSDSSIMSVILHIGNQVFDLGSIEYISSFIDCPLTIVFVGVIVVVLLVVVLTICFLCRRFRRSVISPEKHAPNTDAPPLPYTRSTELHCIKQPPIDELQYEVPIELPMAAPTLNGYVVDQLGLYYNARMEP